MSASCVWASSSRCSNSLFSESIVLSPLPLVPRKITTKSAKCFRSCSLFASSVARCARSLADEWRRASRSSWKRGQRWGYVWGGVRAMISPISTKHIPSFGSWSCTDNIATHTSVVIVYLQSWHSVGATQKISGGHIRNQWRKLLLLRLVVVHCSSSRNKFNLYIFVTKRFPDFTISV